MFDYENVTITKRICPGHERAILIENLWVFFCLVYPMLPVSLDYLFLIAPLVFNNVYYLTASVV